MNHHVANNTMNHHQPSPPIINTTTTNASSSSPRCFQIPTLFPDEQQIVLAQFARDQFSQNGSVTWRRCHLGQTQIDTQYITQHQRRRPAQV